MTIKEVTLFLVCLFSLANSKDVRNVLNKCTAEKPCEVNAGDCTFDDECRGNLICTRNNCKGSTMSLYAKCCQEPGEEANSTTSDEDDDRQTFNRRLSELRKMAIESEGKNLTDPKMRKVPIVVGQIGWHVAYQGVQIVLYAGASVLLAYLFGIGDKNQICSSSDDLIFYEGNDITQETVGSIPTWEWNGDLNYARNLKDLDCFDNDEARSVLILPSFQGRAFIVCDHPTNCGKDDWTYVYIYKMPPNNEGIKINSFEMSGSDEYVYMEHSHKNGLNGKISRIGAWKDKDCQGSNADWSCCSNGSRLGPCKENEGDCDTDSDCERGLVCGTDNCPSGFPSSGYDCCEKLSDWCAKYYEHSDYAGIGWEKVIGETNQLNLINENDQTSSVKVRPGCTLRLFEHINKVGLLYSLTTDVSLLSHNDKVSSLSCTCPENVHVNNLLQSTTHTTPDWNINVGSGKWSNLQNVENACGPQWYGWSGNSAVGSISTTLFKSSKCGRLDFGNCWNTGTVRAYLAGKLIGEAGPNAPRRLIEFAIPENSLLEIKDEGENSVIKFTNFEMVDCSACPAGFVLLPGDLPGWGQIGSNPSTEATISDCSDRCNSEPNCCSFEYSATEKKCNLNRDCQPTQGVYKDYSFCSKDCQGSKATWSCCTSDSPCKEDEGDCDTDGDCESGLVCGTNNCPSGFPSSGYDCCEKASGNILSNGEMLKSNEFLLSKNGLYRAIMQHDGNFVLYKKGTAVLWASHTHGKGTGPYELRMQNDNNLVIYDHHGKVIWSPNTHNSVYQKTGYLNMQDDGNLVLYLGGNGTPLWATNTNES